MISSFTPSGGSIAWLNGTSTAFSTTATGETEGTEAHPCSATSNEFELSGSVTTSTNTSIPLGGSVKMEVCVDFGADTIVLEPHTDLVFGS